MGEKVDQARAVFEESIRHFANSEVIIWGHDELNALIEAAREEGRAECSLNTLSAQITEWGKEKGWDEPLCFGQATATEEPKDPQTYTILAKLALMHSEVSEAVEAARSRNYILYLVGKKPEGFVVEMADALIRGLHICGQLGLDIEGAFRAKMEYNHGRPFRHGGRAA